MTAIVVRHDAVADIEEAFAWYEAQRPGLGNDFRSELRATLEQVARSPERCPVCPPQDSSHFDAAISLWHLLSRYPVTIIVVAVMHARRDPRHWRSRTER